MFDRLARTVCRAECLPRKELYEAWEVARRCRRRFRGGRIVDMCGGHGLLAQVLLVLDAASGAAVVVDPQTPPSAVALHEVLRAEWPRLCGRVEWRTVDIDDVPLDRDDLVVSSHACGALTDRVLERAVSAGARVVVLPCCHDLKTCDSGDLTGWLDGPLAVDIVRARRLVERGYRIWTQTIPAAVTPKNRLLLGQPAIERLCNRCE